MTKREAAEIILAGRRAAARACQEFIVNRERLGDIGGFSTREVDQILAAVHLIETHRDEILEHL